MSSATIKPAFSSVEEEPVLSKPVSKLAIASVILGLFGMLTPFTGALVAIPMVAAVLGLVGSVLLSLKNSTHSGLAMANAGLFLGLLSYSWTYISTATEHKQLEQSGGEFAGHFLETLADGDVYSAAELQQPFPSRQLAGIDLKAYYESFKGSPESVMAEGAAPDPKMLAKSRLDQLRNHPVTKYVSRFPNAKWPLSHLQDVDHNPGNTQFVKVVVLNSEDQSNGVLITLQRMVTEFEGDQRATWCVRDMKLL
jgi:hypothetical protein